MRIPLDYYRILGLPIQAPAEQLAQAHHDRTRQMPRREYSEAALSSRRALLDEAFAVLSNPDDRARYDQRFLTHQYDPDLVVNDGSFTSLRSENSPEQTPHIDIADKNLVGALLILQELGEYELVLKVGRPYLSSGRLSSGNAGLSSGQFGDPQVALSDTVLTIAFACLELGREHWQQGQYETAAEALETGEELLVREGLFEGIRGEIQSDLLRLRPYRILELLALPEAQVVERKKGLQLLQEMLQERDGVDGARDDQSGLSMDDFLRFIQQLRGYLTVEEQQVLFEEEARRPSAVATYLAIYALIARGFAEHQPALVRRAKHLLSKLSARQDVHLEQSICALLLGQTEEANRLLELSQEYEPIAFIREQSQGSPDWLPGLCLYTERWIGGEVFPHFRDLAQQRASLKSYFADDQVQGYLEDLPIEGSESPNPMPAATPTSIHLRPSPVGRLSQASVSPMEVTADSIAVPSRRRTSAAASMGTVARNDADLNEMAIAEARLSDEIEVSQTAPVLDKAVRPAAAIGLGALGAGALATVGAIAQRQGTREKSPEPLLSEEVGSNRDTDAKAIVPIATRIPPRAPRSARTGGPSAGTGKYSRPGKRSKTTWVMPVWLPWALGLVGVMAMGFGISRLMRSAPVASVAPVPSLSPTGVAVPGQPAAIQGDLTDVTAKQVLELWFTAKKAAMGSGYAVGQLEQALIEPKLSVWRKESSDAQRDGAHVEYEHAVDVKKVEIDPTNPNQASVTAAVRELRKYYEGSSLKEQQTDDLQLRYVLIRQNNQWKISNWE